MYRLKISGNFFLIIKDDDGTEHSRHPSKDVRYQIYNETELDPTINFFGLEGEFNSKAGEKDSFLTSVLLDENGDAFVSLTILYGYLDSELGKSSPQASGGASGFSSWIDYNDTTGAISLVADTWTDIPNDGLGLFSNRCTGVLAGGISELLNPLTGELIFSDFKINDDLFLRHDFNIIPDTNNASLEMRYFVGESGSEYPLELPIPRLDRGSGVSYKEVGTNYIYIGDENTRLGGARLQVKLSTTGTLVNNGIAVKYFIY